MLGKLFTLGLSASMILGLASPAWSQANPAVLYTNSNAPAAPKLDSLPLKTSLSQYGMTWTFDKPARVGQFVNGDYYVVGLVTVTDITPRPLYGAEIPADQIDETDRLQPEKNRVRNGFMLNPPATQKVSYDSGVKNWFDPALIQRLPVAMKPGDSLVTTISMKMGVVHHVMLQNSNETESRSVEDSSPVQDAGVLTCVADPLPADAFRPSFCDRAQKIYLARNLRRELLPSYARPADAPKIEEYVRYTQRPWINTGFFGFEEPADNMPWYGQQVGEVTGDAALLLCLDFTPEQKEPLLVNFVQVGIDYGGVVRAGHSGWPGFGGHGSGRKLPIVFAGLLLGDDKLAHVNKSFPKAEFGEDEQTAYGDCWTGAKVVFTGHSGIDEVTGIGRNYARGPNAWGPYEHTPPSTWKQGQLTSEGYRRANTSSAWVAQALALHLLHAEKAWNHDPFFDYVDRWMYEKDEVSRKTLKARGLDYDNEWCREGTCFWTPWVLEVWSKHRAAPGMPPTDGWKQQHDDSYYRTAIEEELKARPQRGG